MSDFVNVYLRVRPDLGEKSQENDFLDTEVSTERMIVVDALPYQFDRVFYKESTQEEVFQQMVSGPVNESQRDCSSYTSLL